MKTNTHGEIIGLSCHDGKIAGIKFLESSSIQLQLINDSGRQINVTLTEVKYFITNNLREGNIVDRAYLWNISSAPPSVISRAAKAFEYDPSVLRKSQTGKTILIFSLECSYGAEIFAIIHTGLEIQEYLNTLVAFRE